MQWNNARFDKLPAHLQVVLVSVEGIYYLTIYDARERIFRLKDQPEGFFDPAQQPVYWTEFTDPEPEKTKDEA